MNEPQPLTPEEYAEQVARDKRNVDRYSRYEPLTPEGRQYLAESRPSTHTHVKHHKPNNTASISHD